MRNFIIVLAILFTFNGLGQEINGRLSWSNDLQKPADRNRTFNLPTNPGNEYAPAEFVSCYGPHLITVNINYSIIRNENKIFLKINYSNSEHNNVYYYQYNGLKTVRISDFGARVSITNISGKANLIYNGKSHSFTIYLDNGDQQNISNECALLGVSKDITGLSISTDLEITFFDYNSADLVNAFKPYFMQNIYKAPVQQSTEQQQGNNNSSNSSNNNSTQNTNSNNQSQYKENTGSYTQYNNLQNDPYYQQLKQQNEILNAQLEQNIHDGMNVIMDAYNYFQAERMANERYDANQKHQYLTLQYENTNKSTNNIGENEHFSFLTGESYGHMFLWNSELKYWSGPKDYSLTLYGFNADYIPKSNLKNFKLSDLAINSFVGKNNLNTKVFFNEENHLIYQLDSYDLKQVSDFWFKNSDLRSKRFYLTKTNRNYLYSEFNVKLGYIGDNSYEYFIDIDYPYQYNKDGEVEIKMLPTYLVVNLHKGVYLTKMPFSISSNTNKIVQVFHTKSGKTVFNHYSTFKNFIEEEVDSQITHMFSPNTSDNSFIQFTDIIRINKSGQYYLYAKLSKKNSNNYINIYLLNFIDGKIISDLSSLKFKRVINLFFNKNDNIVIVGIDKFNCLVKKVYSSKEIINSAIENGIISPYADNTNHSDSFETKNPEFLKLTKQFSLEIPFKQRDVYLNKYWRSKSINILKTEIISNSSEISDTIIMNDTIINGGFSFKNTPNGIKIRDLKSNREASYLFNGTNEYIVERSYDEENSRTNSTYKIRLVQDSNNNFAFIGETIITKLYDDFTLISINHYITILE